LEELLLRDLVVAEPEVVRADVLACLGELRVELDRGLEVRQPRARAPAVHVEQAVRVLERAYFSLRFLPSSSRSLARSRRFFVL